ncbi:MAG: class I SAM-dependent methyltransferase [Cyclobacteriaceae bacterium]
MTRRVKRSNAYELTLVIKDDAFIRPPKEMQRNALLNRAIKEFADDLTALDRQAREFVPGELQPGLSMDRKQEKLSDLEIMEDWQIPIMQAMAEVVCDSHGDVLEIGFGRGISSTMIQEQKVRSHTIIECNDHVVKQYHAWKAGFPHREIRLVHGLWQDTITELDHFDGIFFHTYPLNEGEYMEYVQGSVTFAEHFFATAAEHLRPNGAFTYFSNEIDSLSRAHQRALLGHFSSFSLKTVSLDLPDDVRDTWWANSMVVIKAIK